MQIIFSHLVRRRFLMSGAFVLALFVFLMNFLPTAVDAQAIAPTDPFTSVEYNESTGEIAPQTLIKALNPYLLWTDCNNRVYIPSGTTVTIESGVIVKFFDSVSCGDHTARAGFDVEGNLLVNGTALEPVIFTSYRDDSVGGDTNQDGAATSPYPGSWNAITVGTTTEAIVGSTVSVHNAVFRYGGYSGSMIVVHPFGVNLTLDNLEFSNSNHFGLATERSLVMTSSSFHDNTAGAIAADNAWAPQVDARNSWWGDASGPSTLGNPNGHGQTFTGNVLYDPWIGKPINTAPTLQFVSGNGFDDGVEPNTSFSPAQKPAFQVEYRDAENQAPGEIKLVINSTAYPLTALPGQDGDYTNGELFGFSGPTSTFPKGDYSFHFEATDGALASRLPASGELTFTVKLEPVILIPGILGTEMDQGSTVLWPNFLNMLTSGDDSFMDPLMMSGDGIPSYNDVRIGDVLRINQLFIPQVSFDYFGALTNQFNDAGYQENTDLFVFPYDWRLDNKITAQNLKNKIEAVLAQTGSTKIDLVAHSMGGLVAKQYIVDNGSGKVDKLVFVATPQLGAPKALKALVFGDNFGIPLILNPAEMKKLSQNMSSAYELLPSQNYIQEFGGYFLENGATADTYAETKDYLLNKGANSLLLGNAENFHSQALDNFTAPGSTTYNIVGCNTPTIGRIIKRNNYLEDGVIAEDYDVDEVAGDGTVPLTSALAVKADNRYYVTRADHATMPSMDGIRQLIVQIVSDGVNTSTFPATVRTDPSQCGMVRGKLISVHSPIDLNVYDQNGNHEGPNATGTIDQMIPGATYENIANNKFIFLPEDSGQIYTVKLDATATGTFTFRVSAIANNTTQQTVYYGDTAITPTSRGRMTITPTSDDTILQLDANGTNEFVSIPASSVLSTSTLNDVSKPATTISLAGTVGENSWYISDVTVTLAASDDTSGILATHYSLDNGATWQTYSAPFSISKEGNTTILYQSIDRAGNKEMPKQYSFKIDSTPPVTTLSLQGRSGRSGWYLSSVTTTLAANDVLSGVARIKYSLDGGATWQDYSGPFLVEKEGATVLLYRSVDNAGNVENTKQQEIKIDTTIPEAMITFDPARRDIVVSSPPPATVIDKQEVARVEDPAGNMLELYFAEKDRRHSMRADIDEMLYNGSKLYPTGNNTFAFQWSYDRSGHLTNLIQAVVVQGQVRLRAVYDRQRNTTFVTGLDVTNGRIRASYRGLILIKVFTRRGRLGFVSGYRI